MSARTIALPGYRGLRLVAQALGEPGDPPVVLLHGGGQTRHAWARAAHDFARSGHHSLALDLRGHGDSAWAPDGDYSLDAFSGDVLCVARAQPAAPVLVGASLGGASALIAIGDAVARGEPPPARALVLVDVAPRMAEDGIARITGFMTARPDGFASLEEAAAHIARYLPQRPRPTRLDGLRKNLREGPDGRWRWHWDPAFRGARGLDSDGGLRARMERAARHVTLPTLIVRGLQSELVDEASVQHLRSLIPQAQAAEVAGAGHMVAGDRNDAFTDAVLDFLHRLPPAPD